jgi:hypothetical protein
MSGNTYSRHQALRRFEEARRQALLKGVAARLTGRDTRLLPFEAVRSKLRQQNPLYQGLQEVPVNSILGSAGRYREFTRQFLPLNDNLRERWVSVDSLAKSAGWPPISVYQVGDAYFVEDGNHRVSVARQLNNATIEAHVWKFPGDIHIDPEDKLDDVILRLGEHDFLAETRLDEKFPEHTICFTSPGRYSELLAQIYDLRQKLSLIDGEEMSYDDAVVAWYELIYLPTIQIIRDSTLLNDFPGRTEADLFAWLSIHRERLRETYGDYDNLADLAQILADRYKEGSMAKVARRFRRILGSRELPPLKVEKDTDATETIE